LELGLKVTHAWRERKRQQRSEGFKIPKKYGNSTVSVLWDISGEILKNSEKAYF
jgi:hypothetical protein